MESQPIDARCEIAKDGKSREVLDGQQVDLSQPLSLHFR